VMAAGNASSSSRQGSSGASLLCIGSPIGEWSSVKAAVMLREPCNPDSYQTFPAGWIGAFPQLELALTPRLRNRAKLP
jgi:hypothetical protein